MPQASQGVNVVVHMHAALKGMLDCATARRSKLGAGMCGLAAPWCGWATFLVCPPDATYNRQTWPLARQCTWRSLAHIGLLRSHKLFIPPAQPSLRDPWPTLLQSQYSFIGTEYSRLLQRARAARRRKEGHAGPGVGRGDAGGSQAHTGQRRNTRALHRARRQHTAGEQATHASRATRRGRWQAPERPSARKHRRAPGGGPCRAPGVR